MSKIMFKDDPTKKKTLTFFFLLTVFILNKRKRPVFAVGVFAIFYEMSKRCHMPQISVVVNLSLKDKFFLHEFF